MEHTPKLTVILTLATALVAAPALAQAKRGMEPTPPRRSDEGLGPFRPLVIRGATLVDGTGAPPRGPVDIVVQGNRIAEVRSAGPPGTPPNETARPLRGQHEIDAKGMFVLPGFIDVHTHTGEPEKTPQPEYAYKLWLGHGITTVRGVPPGGFNGTWMLEDKVRSARNEIVAPHIVTYVFPGSGDGWKGGALATPEVAREWVRWAAGQGIDGLKLSAHDPEIMGALIDEAHRHGLGTVTHLGQTGVVRMTGLAAARLGLDELTHFYGLFESILDGKSIQDWPVHYNASSEEDRFREVARLWNQSVEPGSGRWNEVIAELVTRKFVISPTMVVYVSNRDLMQARNADWHEEYTLPDLWKQGCCAQLHGWNHWRNWTTQDEVAWRRFYQKWMRFLDEFNDAGGRIAVGSDGGYMYAINGFGFIQELELLLEAGLHPSEVIRSATLYGAETIAKPEGRPVDYGIVRVGKRADLIVVDGNPLENLKILYGTGHWRLDERTGEATRHRGLRYTIKDGIVYDPARLLADVREMVKKAKGRGHTGQPGR